MITCKFGENTVSLTDYDVVNAIELLSENGPYRYLFLNNLLLKSSNLDPSHHKHQ